MHIPFMLKYMLGLSAPNDIYGFEPILSEIDIDFDYFSLNLGEGPS